MKKIAFVHGFLGSPEDMRPFFIKGAENRSIDLVPFISKEAPVKELSIALESYDVLVGYSFGGRLLGEIKKQNLLRNKKWVLISSRHTPYQKTEIKSRELFRAKLKNLVEEDMTFFLEYWDSLPLFSGHIMNDFRDEHGLVSKIWKREVIIRYLEKHFNSEQFNPAPDSNVHYVYGGKDTKYAEEASRLQDIFQVHKMHDVGHRALFEDVEQFNEILLKICESIK